MFTTVLGPPMHFPCSHYWHILFQCCAYESQVQKKTFEPRPPRSIKNPRLNLPHCSCIPKEPNAELDFFIHPRGGARTPSPPPPSILPLTSFPSSCSPPSLPPPLPTTLPPLSHHLPTSLQLRCFKNQVSSCFLFFCCSSRDRLGRWSSPRAFSWRGCHRSHTQARFSCANSCFAFPASVYD